MNETQHLNLLQKVESLIRRLRWSHEICQDISYPAMFSASISPSTGNFVTTIVWSGQGPQPRGWDRLSTHTLTRVLKDWHDKTSAEYDKRLFAKQWAQKPSGYGRDNAYVMTFYGCWAPSEYDDWGYNDQMEQWPFTTCIHDDFGNLVPVTGWNHGDPAEQIDTGIAFYYGLTQHGQMIPYDQLGQTQEQEHA